MSFIKLFILSYFGMMVNFEAIGCLCLSHIFKGILGMGGVLLPHI